VLLISNPRQEGGRGDLTAGTSKKRGNQYDLAVDPNIQREGPVSSERIPEIAGGRRGGNHTQNSGRV